MIVSTLPSGHDRPPSSSSSHPPSLSVGTSAGTSAGAGTNAGGEGPLGEIHQDELLFAETALSLCGIRTNDTMTKECWPLLSILRRKIKVSLSSFGIPILAVCSLTNIWFLLCWGLCLFIDVIRFYC